MRKLIIVGIVLCVFTMLVGSASAWTFVASGSNQIAQGNNVATGAVSGATNFQGFYAAGGFGAGTAGVYVGSASAAGGFASSNLIAQATSGSVAAAGTP